eukprot:5162279-Pleurochrysis_carterae.AAC.1
MVSDFLALISTITFSYSKRVPVLVRFLIISPSCLLSNQVAALPLADGGPGAKYKECPLGHDCVDWCVFPHPLLHLRSNY